ncbi:MAG: response regulator [Pseudomonadota bacterium]
MNNKQKSSVLIIDDTLGNLKVLFNYLEKANFKVLIAEKGESGLKRLKYLKPDIILLDVIMPDMDGFEVCRRLKANEESKDIPVIFMTTLNDTVDKVKGFELGAVDYITKPVQVEEVLARINTHLTIRHLQKSLLHKNEQLKQEIINCRHVKDELRKFSRAVEQSGNIIVITDTDGTIEFVNPAFSIKTGYSFAEAIGKNFSLLNSGKQPPELYKKLWATISQGKVWQGEMLRERKNGELYWIFSTISPIKDAYSGKISHYVAINEDITKRKQAETKLQQAIKSAEQAKIEAEAANHAKSAFLANMSHELRTPLNGILGYTQILIHDSTLTDKQKQGIQIIHRSGEHLLMLINDILDLSKIEADKLELMPKDFRLPEFLKDIVDLFRMRAKQKDIEFVYEQGAQLPATVHADEKRLRQVLLNLLSNALKFTQQGRVSFKVSPISSQISFSVTDSGEGIAAENLETIFLPFRQVGDQNYQEGTGLGLPISKRLVNMMGGELQVESVLGSGSRFWFKIHLPESKAHLPQSPPPQPTIIGFKTTTNQVFRILVVDDKWENRVVLINLLTPLGFEVLEASDGQEALTKAEQFHPQIIIMDIKMPVMDGLECTRRLRQNAEFEKTVIIALSATVFEHQRQECLKLGCNAFLEKPINTDKFLQILAEHCPIKWIYEKPEEQNENPPAQIIPPNEEQIKALFKLAKYGDVQAVIKEAEALLESEPHLQAFVGEVCQLAKGFKITQLKNFLEQFLVQDKSCTPDEG